MKAAFSLLNLFLDLHFNSVTIHHSLMFRLACGCMSLHVHTVRTYILQIHSAVGISDIFVCWKDQHCSGGAVTSAVVQYSLCIEYTIWTQLAVLHREVALIQRNICTQLYVVGAANSVFIRDVSLIQVSFMERFHFMMRPPQTVHIGTTVCFCCLCLRCYYVLKDQCCSDVL